MPPAEATTAALCVHLAAGLHAAAQPLTILLAGLGRANVHSLQVDELRTLIAGSVKEVQRVCSLFNSLQQLVVAESIPASMSAALLPPLLLHVIDGVRLLFEQDGMRLRLRLPAPETCPPVLVDPERTTQALLNVLLAAHGVSASNDTIDVSITCLGTHALRVLVHKEQHATRNLTADLNLAMAVAEANLCSQGGGFTWSLYPFSVQMEWQPAPTIAIR